jgi:glucose-6-phosphate-specific signal transduction histidine kinase
MGVIGSNIVIMHKAMHGFVTSIKCAPSRYALKEFGGTLSIEEFRELTNNGPRVIVNMPDELYRIQDVIVKRDIKTHMDGDANNKFQEISRSVSSNDTLKLKRQKPLKRDDNNLEKSLGITRKK